MEDKRVDTMEIDGQQQQQGVDAAVPDGFNTDYLRIYYDAKHPGCDQSYIGCRELSFTLENDIYLRFQSFDSADELESSIKEKCPFRIDIGHVYGVDI